MIIPGKIRSLTPPIGVIDSLASGLETVATCLPLLLPPAILDVVFWLGPRVSFGPLLVWLGDYVAADSTPMSSVVVAFVLSLVFPISPVAMILDIVFPGISSAGILEPVRVALMEADQKGFAAVAESIRHLAQSAPDQYLGVSVMPGIAAGHSAGLAPFGYVPPVWQIETLGEALILRFLLFLAGLVVLVVYVAFIAQRVREGHNNLGWVVRRAAVVFLQIVAALIFGLALAVAVLFMLSIILSVIVIFGSMLGGEQVAYVLSAMVVIMALMAFTWVILLMAFTVHGMFMNNRGIFAAMWDSLRVVQWNLSSTFGLFLVIFIVATAVYFVREWLDPGSWLMPVGILANAFVSTGLIAATFVFFKDRYRYWRELRDQLLAELERRRTQQSKT